MCDNNLDNWAVAATIYAETKGENLYSRFCKSFTDKLFSGMDGLRALDAGYGDGEYAEMFRRKGAEAAGCDGSPAVIALARRRHPLCEFDVADLRAPLPYASGTFDLVFSNLVLMDIDPLDTAIREIARVLKPGGRFFFSITHPAFYQGDWERNAEGAVPHKKIATYLAHRVLEMEWGTQPVLHYHRPLSFYLNLLSQNGFHLTQMHEPNVYEDASRPDLPLFLFADLKKSD